MDARRTIGWVLRLCSVFELPAERPEAADIRPQLLQPQRPLRHALDLDRPHLMSSCRRAAAYPTETAVNSGTCQRGRSVVGVSAAAAVRSSSRAMLRTPGDP